MYALEVKQVRALAEHWNEGKSQSIVLLFDVSSLQAVEVAQRFHRYLWEINRYFQQPHRWYAQYGTQFSESFVNHLQRSIRQVQWRFLPILAQEHLPIIQVHCDKIIGHYISLFDAFDGQWWQTSHAWIARLTEAKVIFAKADTSTAHNAYHPFSPEYHLSYMYRSIDWRWSIPEIDEIQWRDSRDWRKFPIFVK